MHQVVQFIHNITKILPQCALRLTNNVKFCVVCTYLQTYFVLSKFFYLYNTSSSTTIIRKYSKSAGSNFIFIFKE